jgi:hypothetical protein
MGRLLGTFFSVRAKNGLLGTFSDRFFSILKKRLRLTVLQKILDAKTKQDWNGLFSNLDDKKGGVF